MKTLSYKQRLMLLVHSAVRDNMQNVTMPYGMTAYVKCAAKCNGRKLISDVQ